MSKPQGRKKPLELADLILEHGLDASLGQIAEVISEWGDLFDDQGPPARTPADAGCGQTQPKPPAPVGNA